MFFMKKMTKIDFWLAQFFTCNRIKVMVGKIIWDLGCFPSCKLRKQCRTLRFVELSQKKFRFLSTNFEMGGCRFEVGRGLLPPVLKGVNLSSFLPWRSSQEKNWYIFFESFGPLWTGQ